jgi:hypothetical protein
MVFRGQFPPKRVRLPLKEMDEVGINLGVIIGRQSVEPLGVIPNDEIVECIRQYPTRLIG